MDRKRSLKKIMVCVLSLALIISMMPEQVKVKAADEPYLISQGRNAYSSSDNWGNTADKVVDGDLGSRWESEHGTDKPQWVYIDLGKVADVTSIFIKWEASYAKAYKIQQSNDEETWTDVYTKTNATGGEETINISFSARYVRLYLTQKFYEQYGYSVFEFMIYGLNGATERPKDYGENIALNKTAKCSRVVEEWWMKDNNGNLKQDEVDKVDAHNAVDGNTGTAFKSYQADGQWVYVDLGKNYDIGRVIVDWNQGAAKVYDVQVSADAKNWTPIYRQFKGYASLTENIVVYKQNVRYVRVYAYTKVNDGGGIEINELQVFAYRNGDPKTTYDIEEIPEAKLIEKGSGSYISGDLNLMKAKVPAYVDPENVQVPIASNDWWQSALISQFGNLMSVMPLKAKYNAKGLNILTGTEGWLPTIGQYDVMAATKSETKTDIYVSPENYAFGSGYDRVSAYSDYSVTLDLCDEYGVQMKTTFVKGCPYLFSDFGNNSIVNVSAAKYTSIFDDNGNEILTNANELVTDHIGIQITDNDNKDGIENSNSFYCLTFPEGTVLKKIGLKISVTLPAGKHYMSVATMNKKSDLKTYFQHGYAFVTDTNVTYSYNENTQEIVTNYKVTTKSMRAGYSDKTMQCMFPHQWKLSDSNDATYTYTSTRGDMHGIFANEFSTKDTFAGILPTFALPTNGEFNSDDCITYLNILENAKRNVSMSGDAYWQGKDLHPLAMGVLMADQLGETSLRDEFLGNIKTILSNWFTYDGANDISYLVYDTNWGTVYYQSSSFGANTGITDHHFTYGYFIFAATVLASYDTEFYNEYKDMIEILIRDYANPSSSDSQFCKFRNYDMYEGHSWAGGYADNDDGNNQESSSEALFSWASLYLWGVLTGDNNYRDAGVFGFSNEMKTAQQYWFDYDNDNWVSDYPYKTVGQVYGGTNFFGTFFNSQPIYVYGIQMCPVSEYLTGYGMNQKACAEVYQGLLNDTDDSRNREMAKMKAEGKSQSELDNFYKDYGTPDSTWQHIAWPFLSLSDSAAAMNKIKTEMSKVQVDDKANTYWFINAMSVLGQKSTDIIVKGNVSACIYKKGNKYTANIWNPTPTSQTVTLVNRATGKSYGTVTIGSKSLMGFEVNEKETINYVQIDTPTFKTTGLNDGKVMNNVSGQINCSDTQLVEIMEAESGATIHYTVDGTTPTINSPVYTGKILVSSTSTVKAIAVKAGMLDSTYASLTVKIAGNATSGANNIAKGKKVTTSSNENDGMSGANVVDGDNSTRWSSQFSDNQWCEIDLGQSYLINKVSILWENSCASEYKILVSEDGKNYKEAAHITNGSAGTKDIVFDPVSARYVKMQGISRVMAYGYSIFEFAVYEALKADAPTITIDGTLVDGVYQGRTKVILKSTVKGSEIKYTLDGSEPNENSPSYMGKLNVYEDVTIKAATYSKGMVMSDVVSTSIKVVRIPGQEEDDEEETTQAPTTNNGETTNVGETTVTPPTTSENITTAPGGQKETIVDNENTISGKKLPRAKIKRVKKSAKKLVVIIKKVKNITGYQVTYSTTKKFKKGKKYTKSISKKRAKIIIKRLKKKVYYVKARVYVKVGKKKKFGKFSKKKRVNLAKK